MDREKGPSPAFSKYPFPLSSPSQIHAPASYTPFSFLPPHQFTPRFPILHLPLKFLFSHCLHSRSSCFSTRSHHARKAPAFLRLLLPRPFRSPVAFSASFPLHTAEGAPREALPVLVSASLQCAPPSSCDFSDTPERAVRSSFARVLVRKMASFRAKWVTCRLSVVAFHLLLAFFFASAQRSFKHEVSALSRSEQGPLSNFLSRAVDFLWQSDQTGYQHVWPEMKFGWQIVVGTVIGFLGAAFGSVGGVGGGGIFVPMLSLIMGFDPKSATAISKCMIMGAAGSTVYYNLKLKHPTLDMPIIDYDLALLIQPMLMLGISIGVAFNVIFADWMVTVLLIILFIGTSTKAFFKGVETWNKETILKKEAAKRLVSDDTGNQEVEYKPLPSGPGNISQRNSRESEVTILENVYWMELGLLVLVWVAFLGIQIAKNHTATCSVGYWVLNLLQVPISFSVSLYEAISLYKGRRVISSKGDHETTFRVHQLVFYCACGVLAGIVGGLLGLGGGFIMGPLFLELGVPPQVSSATATFAMTFSSSMSVVEYYLLNRFPVPYALYFVIVATVAALFGQHIVRKLIIVFGRASLIIFILAFTIFVSAISLGGVGISNMVGKIERHEYMGFENLCKYDG